MTPLDAIRRDLQRLDAELVAALLARAAGDDGGTMPASSRPPRDLETAERFPTTWRALCRAYVHTVLPLLVPGENPRFREASTEPLAGARSTGVPPVSHGRDAHATKGDARASSGTGCAADHAALDLLWRRVASGARVAAAKRATAPAALLDAIRRGDRAAIEAAITHPDIEHRVVERASELVRSEGAGEHHLTADEAACLATAVGEIFRRVVFPLNKQVQVEALLAPVDPGGDA